MKFEYSHCVESANIKSIVYDRISKGLTITFVNNRRYIYGEVPEKVYLGMIKSKSVGKYFYHHINKKFITEEIKNEKSKC